MSSNAKIAKGKVIERRCACCHQTFTIRYASQKYCSRACVSRTFSHRSRHRTFEDVRAHKYVGPGVTVWKEQPLPPAIQKRIDMIVAADMARRLA